MHVAPFLLLVPVVLLLVSSMSCVAVTSQPSGGGEVLYKGIVLPKEW